METAASQAGKNGAATSDGEMYQSAREGEGDSSDWGGDEQATGSTDPGWGAGMDRFVSLATPHIDDAIALLALSKPEVEKQIYELFTMNSEGMTVQDWDLMQTRYTEAEICILTKLLNTNYEAGGRVLKTLRQEMEPAQEKGASFGSTC